MQRSRIHAWWRSGPVLLVMSLSASLLLSGISLARADSNDVQGRQQVTPESVLQDYLRAKYSRDAATTYSLLAAADRATRTLAEHTGQGAAFDGAALAVARALAASIDFNNVDTRVEGSRATVTFDVVLPDANHPVIRDLALDFDPPRLAKLEPDELRERIEQIDRMAQSRQLPVLKSEGENWTLLHEDGAWRVFQNWAQALEIRFEAVTLADLDWEFTPVRERVLAEYGETVQMAYRARNIGTTQSTAKARHIIGPTANAAHIEIVSCFCFLEQTLEPGEEVELPLVLRVAYDAPDEVTHFEIKYEIYPSEAFPGPPSVVGTDG